MRVPLANLRISDNEGDGEAVMVVGDDGPLAGVSIDLVKSVALDERAVAAVEP